MHVNVSVVPLNETDSHISNRSAILNSAPSVVDSSSSVTSLNEQPNISPLVPDSESSSKTSTVKHTLQSAQSANIPSPPVNTVNIPDSPFGPIQIPPIKLPSQQTTASDYRTHSQIPILVTLIGLLFLLIILVIVSKIRSRNNELVERKSFREHYTSFTMPPTVRRASRCTISDTRRASVVSNSSISDTRRASVVSNSTTGCPSYDVIESGTFDYEELYGIKFVSDRDSVYSFDSLYSEFGSIRY